MIYIKGFKTFARPVRMPLEGGVTVIVGPNGSGKSNITDAVLFALGEQSAGVLRAGAMGDLIFSGSETLPASGVAEVTLVLDNGAGEISLPYQEVSITRRISRGGETEYRMNGSRARLTDVRAVAGEAGLGRHSILRQGAVDAIIAGGAAACRLALEEAAGLGVYRRRRLSASRRLEKADAQLEQSRQLEAELANQLRRIEREALAAREYREIESRYRKLSLAHLYRIANQGLDARSEQLEASERSVSKLEASEVSLREKEAHLGSRLHVLEGRLRKIEVYMESLEDVSEDLRSESILSDRILLRVESSSDGEAARETSISRLEAELARLERALGILSKELARVERERAEKSEDHDQARSELRRARVHNAETEKDRSRLTADLEGLRGRRERTVARTAGLVHAPEAYIDNLSRVLSTLEDGDMPDHAPAIGELRESLKKLRSVFDTQTSGAARRLGALETALGRAESRVRNLQMGPSGNGAGLRLHDIIRARPGFEGAVEAALGDSVGGVLAESLAEGIKLLSSTERVALRLDARPVEPHADSPGIPLLNCVEVMDPRYEDAVERLLAGVYVVEEAGRERPENDHVVVTRDGMRLTRTSVSLRREGGRFSREAHLLRETQRLEELKNGAGGTLYDLRERLSAAGDALVMIMKLADFTAALIERVERARAVLVRDARNQLSLAERARRTLVESGRELEEIERQISRLEKVHDVAESKAEQAREELAAASRRAAEVEAILSELQRRRSRLRGSISEGNERRARISSRLERVVDQTEHGTERAARVASRARRSARELSDFVRTCRDRLRRQRTDIAQERRGAEDERESLSRRAVELAGDIATARARANHLREELHHARHFAADALEEIQGEWGATLEDARAESEEQPEDIETERHRLARKLKRFGDVNLLALSQQESLRERHEFVTAQRSDAEAASNDLNHIIKAVDREIETRFSETFEQVRKAFGEMVPRMMDGASGVLDLSEEGVEIGLRLGRKGWRSLNVLSGGERALLALSFLFSIFLSRPGRSGGAFCILDEAEAALDDLNLARFLAVVDSYRSQGQFLLVTHQKRTMAAADVLYGVVQDAAGATTVVSKRMQGE